MRNIAYTNSVRRAEDEGDHFETILPHGHHLQVMSHSHNPETGYLHVGMREHPGPAGHNGPHL
jgi:hypothetical protein